MKGILLLLIPLLTTINAFANHPSALSEEKRDETLELEHVMQQDVNATMSAQSTRILVNLFYRLDLVACPNALLPPTNEMRTYRTLIFFTIRKHRYRCLPTLKSSHIFDQQPLQILSTDEYPTEEYDSRILQYINFQCPENTFGKIMTMETDIQQRVTIGNRDICLDYVQIDYDNGNSVCPDICGNENITTMGCSPTFENRLFVTFRSGPTINDKGFKIAVCCVNLALANQAGCFKTNNQVTVEEYFQKLSSKETFHPVEQDTDYDDKYQDYFKEYYQYLSTVQAQDQGGYIPHDATQQLIKFYQSYSSNALSNSIGSYANILHLAIITEKSCDPADIAVAQTILQVFPREMVIQAKLQALGEFE